MKAAQIIYEAQTSTIAKRKNWDTRRLSADHIKRIPVIWKGFQKNEKLERFKLESLKLESFCLNWKEPSEVEKNRAKLQRTKRSWKGSLKMENY